jgi:hypothetical protein
MMKLAWLVRGFYSYDEDIENDGWEIVFVEPERYTYSKVKPIVYAELG